MLGLLPLGDRHYSFVQELEDIGSERQQFWEGTVLLALHDSTEISTVITADK